MPNRYAYALLLAGATTVAHAQTDFQPGYIVRLAGDTLRGEIDLRDARFNARQCRFRAGADVATYQPTGLQGYGVPAERYIYRSLLVPGETQPAFVRVLVDGPARLYYLRDAAHEDHYYVATATQAPTELVHRKVLLEETRLMQEQNLYRTTLAQALAGCPTAQALLPALPFTPVALTRAVATYNQCQSPQPTPLPAAPGSARQPLQAGVLLGAQLATTYLEFATQYYGQTKLAIGPHVAPALGAFLTLPLSAFSRKLALEAELFYAPERYHYTSAVGNAGNQLSYVLQFDYLRLPLLVRYTFPRGRVRPFLEAGPILAFSLQHRTELQSVDPQGNSTPQPYFFGDGFRGYQYGLGGGVGVRLNYWQGRQAALLLRGETNSGWSDALLFSTYTNRVHVLFTLGLTKAR